MLILNGWNSTNTPILTGLRIAEGLKAVSTWNWHKKSNIYFNEIQRMMYKASVTFDDCNRPMDEKMRIRKACNFHGKGQNWILFCLSGYMTHRLVHTLKLVVVHFLVVERLPNCEPWACYYLFIDIGIDLYTPNSSTQVTHLSRRWYNCTHCRSYTYNI